MSFVSALRQRIEYKASVEKDLRKLGVREALKAMAKIEKSLSSEGNRGEPLAGELAGLFKLRSGDYRVIFARTEQGYLVLRIGYRKNIYRRGRP